MINRVSSDNLPGDLRQRRHGHEWLRQGVTLVVFPRVGAALQLRPRRVGRSPHGLSTITTWTRTSEARTSKEPIS